jgi:hypothetical protein
MGYVSLFSGRWEAGTDAGSGNQGPALEVGLRTCEQVESKVSERELDIARFYPFLEDRGEGPLCSTTRY